MNKASRISEICDRIREHESWPHVRKKKLGEIIGVQTNDCGLRIDLPLSAALDDLQRRLRPHGALREDIRKERTFSGFKSLLKRLLRCMDAVQIERDAASHSAHSGDASRTNVSSPPSQDAEVRAREHPDRPKQRDSVGASPLANPDQQRGNPRKVTQRPADPFDAECGDLGSRAPRVLQLQMTFVHGILSVVRTRDTKVQSRDLIGWWAFIHSHLPWTREDPAPVFLMLLQAAEVQLMWPDTLPTTARVSAIHRPGLGIVATDGGFVWYVGWGDMVFAPSEFARIAKASPWPDFLVVPTANAVLVSPVHPTLATLTELLPDSEFDEYRRDIYLASLARLGPWIEEVVDDVCLQDDPPLPVVSLSFTRNPEARLELVFASQFELATDYLSPSEGPDLLVRWVSDLIGVVIRDRFLEATQLADAAESWGLRLKEGHWRVLLVGHDAIIDLLNRESPPGLKTMWLASRGASIHALECSSLSISARSLGHFLRVEGEYHRDGASLQLSELLEAIKGKRRFFRSRDGTWYEVADRLAAQLDTLASGLQSGDPSGVIVAPWAAMALAEMQADGASVALPSDGLALLLPTRMREALAMNFVMPDGLAMQPRPYQRDAIEWLFRTSHWASGAVLGDDMGLGKTLEALAFITLRAAQGPTLVVASPTLIENWRREADKHIPGRLRVHVVHGAQGSSQLGFPTGGDLVITTYDRLRRDTQDFAGICWKTIVFDEAHELRNARTQRSEAARTVVATQRGNAFVLAMTGTPIQNRLEDAYSIFSLIAPTYFGTQESFLRDFAGPQAADRLRAAIRPFFLRRRKRDVAPELPERVEVLRHIELAEHERRKYEELRVAALRVLDQGAVLGARMQVFAAIQHLRQLACDLRLVEPSYRGLGSKTAAVLSIIETLVAEGRPTLVFSQFTSYLDLIAEGLRGRDVASTRLDGTMSPSQRMAAVDDFQNGGKDVFLISLKAGGVGLNLVRASDVLIVDPWWNQAAEDQAADRAHRIGQDRTVVVHRIIAKDSVEERVMFVSAEKKRLIDRVIEGGTAAKVPTLDELRWLLNA